MLTRLDLRSGGPHAGDVRRAGQGLSCSLPRPGAAKDPPLAEVQSIVAGVRSGGDAAVREYTRRFDGCDVEDLRVSPLAVESALRESAPELRAALLEAKDAITAYHRHQLTEAGPYERNGVRVSELVRPVERAGLYAPGGRARYPSTVLMTAIPARVAGVADLVLCVPPGPGGEVAAPTLAAAALAGVDRVYRVGGAQAIAAMAYGTESIPPVDVIVGPGNVYVSTAKREVAGVVGVPSSFAGPSEVVVVADDETPPSLAAIDLAVQAEHGPDGLAWLVSWSEKAAEAVVSALAELVAASPRRDEIESTLDEGGYAVLVDGPDEAMAVANAIAPEHLELMNEDPEALLPLVRNAGAVFTGPWSPAAVGDYLAGPNHVLPTHGSARFAGALRVDDFLRRIHVVSLDREALLRVAPHVVSLAEAEGLHAHARSIRMRERS